MKHFNLILLLLSLISFVTGINAQVTGPLVTCEGAEFQYCDATGLGGLVLVSGGSPSSIVLPAEGCITVTWNDPSGSIVVYNITGGSTLNTTPAPTLVSTGITALDPINLCEDPDEEQCIQLSGDLGNADGFSWNVDSNLAECVDCRFSTEPTFCVLPGVTGEIPITFTVFLCNQEVTFETRIFVGPPQPEITFPSWVEEEGCILPNSTISICLEDLQGGEVIGWDIPGTSTQGAGPEVNEWFNYDLANPTKRCMRIHVGNQRGCISVEVENECGIGSVHRCLEICEVEPGSEGEKEGPGPHIRSSSRANVTVSPNPFQDFLTIQLDKTSILIESKITVSLTDMTGRQASQSSFIYKGNENIQVPTNELPSGTYYLTLSAENKKLLSKLVIKP